MRTSLLALAALFAAVAGDLQSSSAQESFFNRRFCTYGGGQRSSGMPDCAYNTWEQCVASARGLGRYCGENPFWRPEAPSGNEGRSRRQGGRRIER